MTKRRQDETRQARKSALIVAAVLLAIAAWNYFRQRMGIVWVTGGVGAALAIVGIAVPAGALAFHRLWMKLAHALGWFNSRVLLGAMFYLVMTPVGWVRRMGGGDPLQRRAAPKESYWIPRETTRQDKRQFERLF